jgi:hypothetical protein
MQKCQSKAGIRSVAEDAVKSLQNSRCSPELVSVQVVHNPSCLQLAPACTCSHKIGLEMMTMGPDTTQ